MFTMGIQLNHPMRNMLLFERILHKAKTFRFALLTEREKLIVLSFVVGLLSGFAAILLKNLIHLFSRFLSIGGVFECIGKFGQIF